jgi:tetratricopeptide (TPR) repeat protein
VANALGQWQEGLAYCRRALEHGQAVDDLRLKVVGWLRTGSTYIQQGDAEAGLRCCDEALALSPSAFDAAMIRPVRGYGLLKTGQFDLATRELSEAVGWFDRSNLRYTRSLVALWLAEALIRRGDRPFAVPILEEILATSREYGYRHLEGVVERLLGEALAPAPQAATHLERGRQILEAIGARNDVAKVLTVQAEVLVARGDVHGARRALEEALGIFEALGTIDGPAAVHAALARLG